MSYAEREIIKLLQAGISTVELIAVIESGDYLQPAPVHGPRDVIGEASKAYVATLFRTTRRAA